MSATILPFRRGATIPAENSPAERDALIFKLWQLVNLRNAELELVEAQKAISGEGYDAWAERLEEAEKARDEAFVRLISIPASDFHAHSYKSNKKWRTIGCRKWLRIFRRDWAAILDREHDRLVAERAARVAAKKAKG